MTPGAYLRLRREAAGLTIDDVALRAETIPADHHQSRLRWLKAIEADTAPITPVTARALRQIFAFDWAALDALAMIHAGFGARPPRLCAACACSNYDACVHPIGGDTCAWSDRNPALCSRCAGEAPWTAPPEATAAEGVTFQEEQP